MVALCVHQLAVASEIVVCGSTSRKAWVARSVLA